jgi:hypothetical protein
MGGQSVLLFFTEQVCGSFEKVLKNWTIERSFEVGKGAIIQNEGPTQH